MKQTFDQFPISDAIKQALKGLGYNEPLEVQQKVIPIIMKHQDVIVKSQTGSGKTASFAIPLCEAIDWEENEPQVMVLAPTRELALQIKDEMATIGLYKRIKVAAVFGRQPYKNQLNELKQKTHAVVGTPGRILDHLERGSLDISHVKYLVIDEADEMLNMGFIDQVVRIIKQLPRQRTTILCSATMPDKIVELSQNYMIRPELVEVQAQQLITETIFHSLYEVEQHQKIDFLVQLLAYELPQSVIIFCKTQENVNEIANHLYALHFSVDKIHGGMLQEDRIRNMEDFRRGKFRILVATDVASRGIDIEELTHVINYDLPVEAESYVHRIGRTGRVGKKGKAISLVSKCDKRMLGEIETLIDQSIKVNDDSYVLDFVREEEHNAFLRDHPKYKEVKSKEVKKDVMRLYMNGGKQKKIRATDIVGAITEINGVVGTDIGIIDIQENVSYVDILNGKGKLVLDSLKNKTIKGKKLKIERAAK